MPAESVDNPGGYVLAVHNFYNIPKRATHTTIGGGAVGTHHGYKHRRWIVCKFCVESEIEDIIQQYETDGYYREGTYEAVPSVHDHVKLYDFEISLYKHTATTL